MDEVHFNEYGDIDLVVIVGAQQSKLANPIDHGLIDGMLVSEAVIYHHGPIDHCLCLTDVPLWPYADSEIILTLDGPAAEGTFRVQANGQLDGDFITGEIIYDQDRGYLVFTSPVFLQGLMSMDNSLNSEEPSYKDLQVYHGGQWVTAVISRY